MSNAGVPVELEAGAHTELAREGLRRIIATLREIVRQADDYAVRHGLGVEADDYAVRHGLGVEASPDAV